MTKQEPELDVDAYIKFVEKTARERQVVQGEEFRESDFFMGASCIFYHLKQQDGTKLSLPPRWYVPIIAGRSVLDEIKMSEGE